MSKPLTDWWKERFNDLTLGGEMKDVGVKIESFAVQRRLSGSLSSW